MENLRWYVLKMISIKYRYFQAENAGLYDNIKNLFIYIGLYFFHHCSKHYANTYMATKIGNLYAFCAFFKTADKLLKKFIGCIYLTQCTLGNAHRNTISRSSDFMIISWRWYFKEEMKCAGKILSQFKCNSMFFVFWKTNIKNAIRSMH